MLFITACSPADIGDWEHLLPPQPKGGRYVDGDQIRCLRVVMRPGESEPAAEAQDSFEPMKRTQPTVAGELDVRAESALDAARKMPLGDERAQAMRQATILENAAEMHRHFQRKPAAPAK